MKKIVILLFSVLSVVSCDQIIEKVKKDKRFTGNEAFKTSRQEFKKKLSEQLNLSPKQISNYWGTDSKDGKMVYRLGITINETPKALFTDSISKNVNKIIFDIISEEIVNLKEYNAAVITLRKEKKENGIMKREEYIFENDIK